MRYLKTNKLYCFSPPVMLATFIIELVLAAFAVWRYRQATVTKLTVATLVLLAVFQLAEYNVCEGAFGVDSLTWSRIGYAAISLLPALAVHILSAIAGRSNKILIGTAYALAIGFAIFYMTVGQGVTSSVCGGNYVIFETAPQAIGYYTIFYYGFEILTTLLALYYARVTKVRRTRNALYGLAAGFLCLLIPTTTVTLLYPDAIRAIPSVMCGFAVILALILALYVLPRAVDKKPLK